MFLVFRFLSACLIALFLGVVALPAAASPVGHKPCHQNMAELPAASSVATQVVAAMPDQASRHPCATGHRCYECCFVSYFSQTALVVAMPEGDQVSLPPVSVRVSRAQDGIFKPPRLSA